MKKLFLVLLFCFSLLLTNLDNTLAQENITVDQVLDNYVKALGGKAAIEKLTSRIAKGTYEISPAGISVPLEIYAKAPNKFILKIKASEKEDIQRAFNGKDAWAKDLQIGLREISGSELDLLRTRADFYRAINLKTLYPELKITGKKIIEIEGTTSKKEVYILEATKENSPKETFYFDTQTGLLLRSDIDTEIPRAIEREETKNGSTYPVYEPEKAKVPIQVYYEDYKEIDGIKFPMTTRQSILQTNVIIRLSNIEHNKTVEDDLFNQPKK